MNKTLQQVAFDRNAEIISAYFADFYYNKLYSLASNHFARNGGKSKTETYVAFLNDYLRTLKEHDTKSRLGKDDKDSSISIQEMTLALHKYYDQHAGVGQRAIGEFINTLVSQFVPSEYYEVMQSAERNSIARDILRKTAIEIGERCARKDMIVFVIDDRKNPVGPTILQNKGLDIMRQYRASFISELTNRASGVKSRSRMVSGELFESTRQVLMQTAQESSRLEADLISLKRKYIVLEAKNKALNAELCKLTQALLAAQTNVASVAAQTNVASVAAQPISVPYVAPAKPRVNTRCKPMITETTAPMEEKVDVSAHADSHAPAATTDADSDHEDAGFALNISDGEEEPSRMKSESDEEAEASQRELGKIAGKIARKNVRP